MSNISSKQGRRSFRFRPKANPHKRTQEKETAQGSGCENPNKNPKAAYFVGPPKTNAPTPRCLFVQTPLDLPDARLISGQGNSLGAAAAGVLKSEKNVSLVGSNMVAGVDSTSFFSKTCRVPWVSGGFLEVFWRFSRP